MIRIKHSDGVQYIVRDDKKVKIILPSKPLRGKQSRIIGYIKETTFFAVNKHKDFLREKDGWGIAAFIICNPSRFGFDKLRLVIKGSVHQIQLKKIQAKESFQYPGFEEQKVIDLDTDLL